MADENPSRSVTEVDEESQIAASRSTGTARTPSHRSSKRRRNIVILIVVLGVLVGGVFLWRYLSSYESTDDAQADVHLSPVSGRISGYVTPVKSWYNHSV